MTEPQQSAVKIGCAELGKDGLYIPVCTRVHALHTHLKNCKAERANLQTLNTPPFLEKNQKFVFVFVRNPSIGLTANTALY